MDKKKRTDFMYDPIVRDALKILPWIFLWAAISTGLDQLRDPTSLLNIINNVRAFFPVIVGAVTAMVVLHIRKKRTYDLSKSSLIFFAAYGVVALISTIVYSPNLKIALYWGVAYLSVFVVIQYLLILRNPSKTISILFSFNRLAIFGIAGMSIIFALIFGIRFGMSDIFFSFLGSLKPNGIGRFVALAGMSSAIYFFHTKKKKWLTMALGSLGLLLYSHSRTAIMAVSIIALFFGWRYQKKALFAGVLALVIISLFFLPQLAGYVIKYEENPSFLHGRSAVWSKIIEVIPDSPVLGFGFHGDRYLIGDQAHNSILHALMQGGGIGALLFAIGFLLMIWRALKLMMTKRELKPEAWEAIVYVLFFALRGITESSGAFFGIDVLLMSAAILIIEDNLGKTK